MTGESKPKRKRGSTKNKRTALAKMLGARIKLYRLRLRPFIKGLQEGRSLSDNQMQYVQTHMELIESCAGRLAEVGLSVQEAVEAASSSGPAKGQRKAKKGKRLKWKTRARRGGVGVYNFGPSQRNWR